MSAESQTAAGIDKRKILQEMQDIDNNNNAVGGEVHFIYFLLHAPQLRPFKLK